MSVRDSTLASVLDRTVREHGARPGLLSDARSLDWASLGREANQVAHLLLRTGVEPGDVVGFVLDKRPEVVVGFLACARIGAIVAPVNFKLPAPQIRDQFLTSGMRAVLTQRDLAPLVEGLVDRGRTIVVGQPLNGAVAYADHRDLPATAPKAFVPEPDTVCYYNYTSGTTGRPKGAVTTHRNILENAAATIAGLGFQPEDVFLGMFSVFAHPHELFHRSLLLGGSFAIVDSLSPRVIAAAIERHAVTWMMAVPSFYEMLAESGQRLESLRVLEAGGAHVGPDVVARMEETFGAAFVRVWGCTEATGVGLAPRAGGESSFPMPGYEIAVFGEDDTPVGTDEVGELCIRGPAVAAGYVNAPDETARLFRGGWYHTQDLVRVQRDGGVQFVGRISDMMKIGGIRVYPLEIEEALRAHPDVKVAAVLGAADRIRGEIARAVVELVPGSVIERKALLAFCRSRLAGYKVPRVLEIWSSVPRLANGKVDRRAILERPLDRARDDRG
jgi:long-chain acyl-CoA synthetase